MINCYLIRKVKILNSMINGSKICSSYPENFYGSSSYITDSKSIAQYFNSFFTNVGYTSMRKSKLDVYLKVYLKHWNVQHYHFMQICIL